MPDSEQILLTGTKYRKQNSVSVKQIQDSGFAEGIMPDGEQILLTGTKYQKQILIIHRLVENLQAFYFYIPLQTLCGKTSNPFAKDELKLEVKNKVLKVKKAENKRTG